MAKSKVRNKAKKKHKNPNWKQKRDGSKDRTFMKLCWYAKWEEEDDCEQAGIPYDWKVVADYMGVDYDDWYDWFESPASKSLLPIEHSLEEIAERFDVTIDEYLKYERMHDDGKEAS